MSSDSYSFISKWQVNASPAEVYDIISDSQELSRWWPAVYLDVAELKPGTENGEGKMIALYTKGYLPYSLKWQFEVKKVIKGETIEIEASGNLIGSGKWVFEAKEGGTALTYYWNIKTNKPLLNYFSWLLKPAFESNHEWAMRKGLESLLLEIRRRKGEMNVPLPPGPTFPHNFLNNKVY